MAHLKRLVAPKTWPIVRKESVFVTKPYPRARLEYSIPLSILLRDIMKLGDTTHEIRKILNEGNVKINGKVRRDLKFPATILDVVEIEKLGKVYRVGFNKLGKIALEETSNTKHRLARVENKTKVTGGKIQLNLLDGTNVLADKDEYKTGDVVKLTVPENKVSGKISPHTGANVLVIGGKHIGETAKIKSLHLEKAPKEVVLQGEAGEFRTRFANVHL